MMEYIFLGVILLIYLAYYLEHKNHDKNRH